MRLRFVYLIITPHAIHTILLPFIYVHVVVVFRSDDMPFFTWDLNIYILDYLYIVCGKLKTLKVVRARHICVVFVLQVSASCEP